MKPQRRQIHTTLLYDFKLRHGIVGSAGNIKHDLFEDDLSVSVLYVS